MMLKEILEKAKELSEKGVIELYGIKYKFLSCDPPSCPCNVCGRLPVPWDDVCDVCAELDMVNNKSNYLVEEEIYSKAIDLIKKGFMIFDGRVYKLDIAPSNGSACKCCCVFCDFSEDLCKICTLRDRLSKDGRICYLSEIKTKK